MEDPAQGLEQILRRALSLLVEDIGLATILASPTFECPETLELRAQLSRYVTTILERARQGEILRTDIDADDIRRLISGTHHALKAGPGRPDQVERFLRILLDGLRPER